MKISNAARLIFWLAAIFAIGILVRAESSEKRANIANTKSAPLRIVDQNGRPAVNGVPSPTGAIVDVTTSARATERGLRPEAALAANDAYDFFAPLGDLIMWGPTGTNVGDLHVMLLHP